jgi:hypothetical protein
MGLLAVVLWSAWFSALRTPGRCTIGCYSSSWSVLSVVLWPSCKGFSVLRRPGRCMLRCSTTKESSKGSKLRGYVFVKERTSSFRKFPFPMKRNLVA